MYALMGLILGAFVSLFAAVGGLATAAFSADPTRRFGVVGLFGTAAIFVLPLFYGAIGFVVTLVSAWVYNMTARLTGGMEIDVS
jgi:hypothetical protein